MNDCCKDNEHPDHSNQLSRLNRIGGQVDGIKKMIEEKRYCPEILTQLRAIRSAIQSVETNILEDHLRSCVVTAFRSDDTDQREQKIDEISALFKRYSD